MSRGIALCIIPAVLVALCVPVAADVSGAVVDVEGKPIPAAKLWVLDYSNTSGLKTTLVYSDRAGKFIAKCGANCRVLVAANGYAWGTVDPNSAPATVTLYPEGRVRGKVVDENGKPVAGATVRVESIWASHATGLSYDYYMPEVFEPSRLTTASDGSFVLLHLPDTAEWQSVSCSVEVSAPGRALVKVSLNPEELAKDLVLTDPLECRIEGTMWLPGRTGPAPKDGPWLMVQIPWPGGGWETRLIPVTDDGKFALGKLPPGKVSVMLASPGYRITERGPEFIQREWALPAAVDVWLSPGAAKVLDLELVRGSAISGKVVFKDGRSVSGARVLMTHAGRPEGTPPDETSSAADGTFSMRAAPGPVTVMVQQFRHEEQTVYYPDELRPSVRVTAVDSTDVADVVVEVDPAYQPLHPWEAAYRPVPDDFEFTAGSYELRWDPTIDCSQLAHRQEPFAQGEKAKRLLANPVKTVSTNALYRAFRFDGTDDGGLLYVVVDESGGTGKGYDTAYVDVNRNADLTDDTPVQFDPVNRDHQYSYTDPIEVPVSAGGTERRGTVSVQVYRYDDDNLRVSLGRRGAFVGTVQTNKGPAQCISVDCDGDGRYGKRTTPGSDPADSLFIDTNGWRSAAVFPYGAQAVPVFEINRIGSRFYCINASSSGASVTIEPYSGPMGRLHLRGVDIYGLNAKATEVHLDGDNGRFQLSVDGPVEVPAGQYQIPQCSFSILGKQGRTLQIFCKLESPVVVEPGELTDRVIGGKLSVAVSPDKHRMAMSPGSTLINWTITLGGGVSVLSLGDSSKGQSPKIRFYDKKGKLLRSTTAGYT